MNGSVTHELEHTLHIVNKIMFGRFNLEIESTSTITGLV